MPATVNFYGLKTLKTENFILQKVIELLQEKQKILIYCNQEQKVQLNSLFSSYKTFIPFGYEEDGYLNMQPVLISTQFVEHYHATYTLVCKNFSQEKIKFFSQNIIICFSFTSMKEKIEARHFWSVFKNRKFALKYTEL